MIKATKYHLLVSLALLLPALSFAQYVGGNGNVATSSTYTLISCAMPPQFSPFFGGSGNLKTSDTKTYSACGTPASFYAYMGGNDEGSALLTYTTTTCSTPAAFYAYFGGTDDGATALTYTTTVCSTPPQFYAYMGGTDDGSAITTFTQCSVNPPVAQFSVSTQTVCVGNAISYTDQSTNTPISWNWTFAGGTPSVSTTQNPNVVYNTPGVYSVTLTVTNAFGSDTEVMTNSITVNALPTVDAGNNATVCSGNATVLNASGATSYSWNPPTGLSSTTVSNPVANPTITTIYTVTGTQNGCSKTDVVTVNVTAAPVANAGPDLNLCVGSNTTINASGGGTYNWSPAQGLSSTTSANPIVSTTNTTTYTLTVSNGACSDVDVVTITVKSLPTANAGTDVTICNGNSTVLNASGGSSYTWTPSGSLNFPNSANPTATPITTTNYTLTVSDGTCTAKDIVTVSVTPLPLANAGTDATVCIGASTTLTATGGTSYSWTPATGLSATNIASPVANPTITTDYTVTVTNNGCAKDDVVRVNVLAAPTANAGADKSVCLGSTTTFNASGGTSYLWTPATGLSSNTVANPVVSTTTNATYTVTVSNGACSSTDEVNVTVLSLPSVSAGLDKTICSGDSVTLNGSGGVTYTWSPTTYFDGWTYHPIIDYPNSMTPKVFPYVNGTTIYTLTASNGSCTATDVVNVTVVSPPTPNAGSDVTICLGNSVGLNASGGISYTWTPVFNIDNPNVSNPIVNPTSTTDYTVSVSNGVCVRNDNVLVTVQTAPTAYAGPDINLCNGSSSTLNATGGVSYVWSPSTGLSNPGIATPIVTKTNTTNYTVTVTNAGGCSSTDVMTVFAIAKPTVDAGLDQTICNGASVMMNPTTSGTTFTWNPTGAFDFPYSLNPNASPSSTSIFTLTASNGTCTASDVVTVSVTPLPNVDAGTDVSICFGASTMLNGSGGISYTWTPSAGLNNVNIPNPTANPSVTTVYTLTASNSGGCVSSDVVTVTVDNTPFANAGSDINLCYGSSATLNASGGATYVWSPPQGLSNTGIPNPVVTTTITTSYTVTVTTSGGCVSTDVVVVNAKPLPMVDAGSNQTICQGNSVVMNPSTTGTTYTWSPSGVFDFPNSYAPTATLGGTSTLTLTVSDGTCTASDVVTVSVTPLPLANAGNDVTICTGTSATLTATGGSTYTWTPSSGLDNPNSASPVANPSVTTSYTVIVGDNGCTATDVVSVIVTNSLVIDAGVDQTICDGQSTTMIATGGSTYTWTPSSGLSANTGYSVVANPTITTTYTVNAGSGGCSASDEITIFVNPTPTVSISAIGNTTFCVGGSVDLVASSSASSYTWNTGATTSSITATTSDNYYVTVSNGSCTATSSVIAVTVYSPSVASITPASSATFCAGGSVVLSANTGTNYAWSTGATTQTINVSVAGIYSVSVDDLYGCAAATTASIEVVVNPNPSTPTITALGPSSICIGDSVILSTDVADAYLWSNGATTQTVAVLVAGSYSVTNYNIYNCGTSSTGFTVEVDDPLADFTGTPTLVFIPNAVTTFTANTTGFPPYTYAWDFGDGGTSTLAAPSHTYNTIAYETVSLTVTDNAGCSKTIVKNDYIEVEQLFPSYASVTSTTIDITGVSFQDPTKGIIVLADGNCGLSIDSGKVFTPLPTGNSVPLTGACALPGKWFVTGKNGTVLTSIDDGANWSPVATGTTEDINASHFSSVSLGHIVGKNGTIQKYNGTVFTPESSGSTEHLNGIFELSNGNAFAVGDNQTILAYDGSNWSAQSSPINFNIKDVRFSNLVNGFAVGSNGNILQTSDGGLNWVPSLTGVDVDFNSVEVASSDTIWATGTGGIVYKSVDNGNNWIRYSVGNKGDQSTLRVKGGGGKGIVVGAGGNARWFNGNDSTGIPTKATTIIKALGGFEIYPNPARDQFSLKGFLPVEEDITIDIKDAQAKHIKRIESRGFSGNFVEQISTDYYSPGIYFIHIQVGKQMLVKKLIIMK